VTQKARHCVLNHSLRKGIHNSHTQKLEKFGMLTVHTCEKCTKHLGDIYKGSPHQGGGVGQNANKSRQCKRTSTFTQHV